MTKDFEPTSIPRTEQDSNKVSKSKDLEISEFGLVCSLYL
jgi:hypothetical protein